jgi:hypothetical protein
MLWGDVLANLRLPHWPHAAQWLNRASIILMVFLLLNIGLFALEGARALALPMSPEEAAWQTVTSPSWVVAEGLRELDFLPGDKVAVIGYSFDAAWARLARLQIVAELFPWDARRFWEADSFVQSRVIQAFARSPAKAIVSEQSPNELPKGWVRVKDSSFALYFLSGRMTASFPNRE